MICCTMFKHQYSYVKFRSELYVVRDRKSKLCYVNWIRQYNAKLYYTKQLVY